MPYLWQQRPYGDQDSLGNAYLGTHNKYKRHILNRAKCNEIVICFGHVHCFGNKGNGNISQGLCAINRMVTQAMEGLSVYLIYSKHKSLFGNEIAR